MTTYFARQMRIEAADIWERFLHHLEKAQLEETVFRTSPRVAARVLGYALIHAPSDVGRDCVAREVHDCHNDPEVLAGLAHFYIYGSHKPKGPYATQFLRPESSTIVRGDRGGP
ncbi:hypothetical protein BD311DRAFT_757020 [Dichomitus squalens]|uniref:Uncharacterized protein n=1 Tax=Dichomitus squalens TaxID=114155 RepID=A0A4Q9MPP4_9APHY|nr:hypothetical protein BD311DRAFT_757020 [Dichomitus squalens]